MSGRTKVSKGSKNSKEVDKINDVPSQTFDEIIWPDWIDSEVNSEKWDVGKLKSSIKLQDDHLFEDPYLVELPPSLEPWVVDWKRPTEVFGNEIPLCIFDPDSAVPTPPDLTQGTQNKKILSQSPLLRHIVSSVQVLHYLGETQVERQSPHGFTAVKNQPWVPWNHVYSNCSVGKGAPHKPMVNSSGKYIIRLYFLGNWRKITVDDKLPVDENDRVLLPAVVRRSDRGAAIELWPFLLAKALVKVAAMTWTNRREVVDFDAVSCLTTWSVHRIDTVGMDTEKIWETIITLSNHFSWEPLEEEDANLSKSANNSPKDKKKQSKSSPKKPVEVEQPPPKTYLFAVCNDLSKSDPETVPDLSPCWSHQFLIEQTRNIPLHRPPPKPVLPKWKHYRWIDWAIEHGLWPADIPPPPIKSVKMVSFMRQSALVDMNKKPSNESLEIKLAMHFVDKNIKKKGDAKSLKSEKSGKSGKSTKGKEEPPERPDLSIWGDFFKLGPYIQELLVFYRPSSFPTKIRISNIKTSDDPKSPKDIMNYEVYWPTALKRCRNEPLYMFMDSVDPKELLVEFSSQCFKPTVTKSVSENLQQSDSVTSDIMNISNKSQTTVVDEIPQHVVKPNVIGETYDWSKFKNGDTVLFLKTFGVVAIVIKFEPGRFMLKFWISCEKPYVINVYSDTILSIGSWETVSSAMVIESTRLVQLTDDVCEKFKLLSTSMGTPEYQECLRSFFNSFKPECETSNYIHKLIDEVFMDELLNVIRKTETDLISIEEELLAMKTLFLCLDIKISNKSKESVVSSSSSLSESLSLSKSKSEEKISGSSDGESFLKLNNAALKIQGLFRGIYARKLQSFQNTENQKYSLIMKTLKTIYELYFSSLKRDEYIATVLRSVIMNEKFAKYYKIYDDLLSVIDMKTISDSVECRESNRVFLTRLKMECLRPVLLRMDLYSQVPFFAIRVVDNDTGEEIKCHIHYVVPWLYRKNTRGYSILAYGWSTEPLPSRCQWKLNISNLRTSNDFYKIKTAHLNVEKLIGNYIPNCRNIITKYIFKTIKTSMLTLLIDLANKDAEIIFRCKNSNGDILMENKGVGMMLIPALLLINTQNELLEKQAEPKPKKNLKGKRSSSGGSSRESKRRSDPKEEIKHGGTVIEEFYVEIILLKNSWPLNKTELAFVEEVRESMLLRNVNKATSSSPVNLNTTRRRASKKSPNNSKTVMNLSTASYVVYIATNVDSRLSFELDMRRENEILEMKRSWEAVDPGRAERAFNYRQKFLEENNMVGGSSASLLSNISSKVNLAELEKSKSSIKSRKKLQFLFSEQAQKSTQSIKKQGSGSKQEISKLMHFPEDILAYTKVDENYDYLKYFLLNTFGDMITTDMRWVKSEEDERCLSQIREKEVEKFREYYDSYIAKMEEEMMIHSNRYDFLCQWFENEKNLSNYLMQEAFLKLDEQVKKYHLKLQAESGAPIKNAKKKKK